MARAHRGHRGNLSVGARTTNLIAVAGFGGAVSAGTALKTGSPAESRSSPFRASERLHERSPSPSARGY